MEEWKSGRIEEWKSGKVEGWASYPDLYSCVRSHPFTHPSNLPPFHPKWCRTPLRPHGLRHISKDPDGLFNAGGPGIAATDAQAIAEVLSVCRENAARGDGNPMLIYRASGEFGSVHVRIELNP